MARRSPPRPRPHRASPPTLEGLEDRTLPSTSLPAAAAPSTTGAHSSTDILVQFQTGAGQPTPVALPGTTLAMALGAPGLYDVQLDAGTSVDQALAAYRANADVVAAEPDYLLAAAAVPNDPQFSQQWGLNNTGQSGGTPGADVHAETAWNATTGSPNVPVAVLDTGVDYNNPDLYLNIWINQAEIPASRMKNLVDVDGDGHISFRDLNNPVNQGQFKITDVNGDGVIDAADILAPMQLDSQGHDTGWGGWAYPGNTQDGDTAHPNDFIGWNFVNNTNNPLDDNGHGTHVAGDLGAVGNNGVGVAGVDWNVPIMAVKFIAANGIGGVGDYVASLQYAAAHGAKIINNSWSGAPTSTTLQQAIAATTQKGIIFVAAAGNNSSNNDTSPNYPSSYALPNVVAVAASDQSDNLASFSDYGPNSVALAAPGVNIQSTLPGGQFGSMSGTSMAAPLVSGALALVWGEHPNWTYQQVIDQVLSTVTPTQGLAGKVKSGGVLNIAAAVGANTTPVVPTVLPKVVSATANGPEMNTIKDVRLTFNEAIDPTTLGPGAITLTGPGGQTVTIQSVTPVAGSNTTQFDVLFATQGTGGTYTFAVGSSVRDTAGNALVPYQTTFSLLPTSTNLSTQPVPLTLTSKWYLSTIQVNQPLAIGKVLVQLNLTYPKDGELYIFLQAPDGSTIVLSNRRGGTGANFQGTLFDDQATTAIASGQAPFSGTYRPDVKLSLLNGKNAQGTWRLWVQNLGGSGTGSLNNWSLTFIPQTTGAASSGLKTASIAFATTSSSGSNPPSGPGNSDGAPSDGHGPDAVTPSGTAFTPLGAPPKSRRPNGSGEWLNADGGLNGGN